eukprot:TRINITY_DN24649_c0_g1_i1.p1 TRINITY_DN24649_c0_g1~~TRINITY_DN24649_c0_g1_i1.p1  ORF type:complete len:169 (+),score=65.31 TRINITY_DN24649_c0_g1_i1:164-670(+)
MCIRDREYTDAFIKGINQCAAELHAREAALNAQLDGFASLTDRHSELEKENMSTEEKLADAERHRDETRSQLESMLRKMADQEAEIAAAREREENHLEEIKMLREVATEKTTEAQQLNKELAQLRRGLSACGQAPLRENNRSDLISSFHASRVEAMQEKVLTPSRTVR